MWARRLDVPSASTDDIAERNGDASVSMTSSLDASKDFTVELNAKVPRWFARNVRHVGDGAPSR